MGEALGLLGAGVLAGIVSVVASLASLVSYPALLAVGLSPLSANVTNTVALTFTGVGAAAGSRAELAGQAGRAVRLAALTAAGGLTGAALLLAGPPGAFETVVPILVAGASGVLLAGPRLTRLLGPLAPEQGATGGWSVRLAVYAVSVYTGYFGAAGGVLMLAVLTVMLQLPLLGATALKNVIAGVANAFASLVFVALGPVSWRAALPMAVGFLVGGWIGPAVVRRLPTHHLRVGIALCGLGVAVKLAVSTYR